VAASLLENCVRGRASRMAERGLVERCSSPVSASSFLSKTISIWSCWPIGWWTIQLVMILGSSAPLPP